mmetsp:Transcript_1787/g.2715  ORF Transcript_1787/g.2715 Transcript_1787/m.2715 type:complete len:101 (+) Transcript_1787:322-624(+)|eukprot:CAMPEP_0194297290 /NCGR_PEP_ID=MMETSP0169-20130528/58501_1 /TAXON_ID=218684 /ORGANISM="Corethron pennatum, Strain L29A3" /LENGTH=100 /DNA_ID=CAMNT_0039047043 /DNA_START=302 /DNA_END=604 /DNA_ORIENTATION=+
MNCGDGYLDTWNYIVDAVNPLALLCNNDKATDSDITDGEIIYGGMNKEMKDLKCLSVSDVSNTHSSCRSLSKDSSLANCGSELNQSVEFDLTNWFEYNDI